MGRPRTTTTVPQCPRGHLGHVRLAGRRPRSDGLYSRPIYWCYFDPTDPRKRHRFTAGHEHRTDLHPAGAACPECQTTPGRHQGPVVVPTWDFEAQIIAEALILVGRGLSFREAAQTIRHASRRYVEVADGIAYASRDGGLVARYLDLFGGPVVRSVAHTHWPRILLLDAVPLRSTVINAGGIRATEAKGAFLAASGYTRPGSHYFTAEGREILDPARPHLWHVQLAGGLDMLSWLDLLGTLDGEPEWVVCDDDAAIKAAVRERWGGRPVIYSCEGHLLRLFEKFAARDGFSPIEAKALWGDALRDEDHWREFLARVLSRPIADVEEIAEWVGRSHELVERQFGLRRRGYPRGTGAMEAALGRIDEWIGRRRKTFQNVRRLNFVLALMRAQLGGHADPAAYAQIVRAEIERLRTESPDRFGRPVIDWWKHLDPPGVRGVSELVDQAAARRQALQADYLGAAKRRSIERKALLTNAYHSSVGAPLVEVMPAARSASVRTAGKPLSDFPLVFREWDPDQNGGDAPADEPASSSKRRQWRCHFDPSHTWPAVVNQRCARLTGCPDCSKAARRKRRVSQPKRTKSLAEIAAAAGVVGETEQVA